jgi:hypothetical protein
MNKLILFGVFVSVTCCVYSQQNTVATGQDNSGSGGTISLSIGQIDYQNTTTTNGNVSQGVQQPFELFPLSLPENSQYTIELFPNPTSEQLTINISNPNAFKDYFIYDMKGKIILNGTLESEKTTINLEPFATGEYHLIMQNNLDQSYTYKITKL